MKRGARSRTLAERTNAMADANIDCPARHCWVLDPSDRHGIKRPGLLVEWRKADGGWEGRVVYVASLRPGTWSLIEEWIDEKLLSRP